jgi:hypothetical protein
MMDAGKKAVGEAEEFNIQLMVQKFWEV